MCTLHLPLVLRWAKCLIGIVITIVLFLDFKKRGEQWVQRKWDEMRGGLWSVEVQKISTEEKGQCHSRGPTWTTTKSPRSGRASSRASDRKQHRSHSVLRSRRRRRNWRQVIAGAPGGPLQRKTTHLSFTVSNDWQLTSCLVIFKGAEKKIKICLHVMDYWHKQVVLWYTGQPECCIVLLILCSDSPSHEECARVSLLGSAVALVRPEPEEPPGSSQTWRQHAAEYAGYWHTEARRRAGLIDPVGASNCAPAGAGAAASLAAAQESPAGVSFRPLSRCPHQHPQCPHRSGQEPGHEIQGCR